LESSLPIRSMTGYAQAVKEEAELRVAVEMRAVNNRFADVRFRLPSDLQPLEADLRRRVLEVVRRGRVDVTLNVERLGEAGREVRVNRELLARLSEAAAVLRDEHGVRGDLDVSTVLGFGGVIETVEQARAWGPEQKTLVESVVGAALAALDAERVREGETLRRDLLGRLDTMSDLAERVDACTRVIPGELQRKVSERIATLVQGVEPDPGRLAQEIAFLAERADVSEEVVRLRGHLGQARTLLAEPDGDPVGKRMDFLLQEILRETNTINSKSPDLELSRLALGLKLETEKVREQVQNLE